MQQLQHLQRGLHVVRQNRRDARDVHDANNLSRIVSQYLQDGVRPIGFVTHGPEVREGLLRGSSFFFFFGQLVAERHEEAPVADALHAREGQNAG